MGLGLTLVQRLVTLHGGSVEARSEGLGRGSEFAIRLPLATGEQVVVPRSPTPPPPSMGPRKVVLVDDSEDIRSLFEELLRAAGHVVATGADGPQGVETIVAARPDVAFVDVGLPGFDGYEVARRVRAELGGTVALVAMTGYGQNEDRARAMEAGFDRHLTKPVDIRALEALVAEAPRLVRSRPA
jgi:CheY-like chemotaxis protein